MTATALEILNSAFIKYCRPNCFELRYKSSTCEAYEKALANLLDTPLGKLCLEAPCNWTELFKRLRHNTCLFDLEIYDCGFRMYSSLKGLAEAMLENLTLRRLKICISFPEMDECAIDLWRKLAQSIGRNRGLKSLILDAWNICDRSIAIMESLAEAIAQNKTLEELSLENEYVPAESLLLVLHGLARNNTIKTLHIGAFLESEGINRQMLNCVAELGLSERVDCEYALDSGTRPRNSHEAYETVRFRKVRVEDVLALSIHYTNVLHGLQDTLTSLVVNIVSGVPIADDGAQCLADMFSNGNVLEHVTLLFLAGASVAITILGGLARSRTLNTVVVGRQWSLSRNVAIAFEETFQNNSSIAELTIWQYTRLGFEELKAHIRAGVKGNYAISKVQFLYGDDKEESYDWELFQMLQCNRIVASWAADIIRGHSFTRECTYAFVRMSACNNCRTVLRRTTGCDSEELESRIIEIYKRAEKEMPEVLRSARESCHVGKPGSNTNAFRTFNKDFIEEVTIFFAAQNEPPVVRTPNFDYPS
ncbi:hypothetical protein HPB50_025228 [Hyalomma asiaticum]|uniref:Uncharacterized protein n=1 Tax=Hyalomma asiaticum TaxID=266040 RepID=A0ACB7TT58_HYAAI|nr:hypothetical protein HPB50_025228 [Hyalomma asiaticum]